ncbi:UDP-N-acetylmuramate--L-alanine ligase [bacterium]|nr:UDP-N-acetylmuramate--L-alanine ligase [bacterium]
MYNKIKHIHLIGIGGIGMSGLGQLLAQDGYRVTGSDAGRGETVRLLEAQGIHVFLGHDPSHIEGAELVVYSSAISPQNPERVAAAQKDILTIPRAEMLAEMMRLKYGVAIAGAHGKTTTTSMTGVVLEYAGMDPTVIVGGRVDNFGGTNARPGDGEFMVVEADESDGSFNRLTPSIAVITNFDREHLDHYGSLEALETAFLAFANKIPFYGLNIFCGDDPVLQRLATKVQRRKKSYGFEASNAYSIRKYTPAPEGSVFEVHTPTGPVTLRLRVPGRHNALNAVAALMVADELGISRDKTAQALSSYRGVARRFQHRGDKEGVRFFDDYAHHPTEIRATLAAARERFPESRVRVVFQPHRYSRLADLWSEFSECFGDCDGIAVTDVYAAGEAPRDGITAAKFAEQLSTRHAGAQRVATGWDGVELWMKDAVPGDVILTLGAGDLPNVYQKLF